MSAATDAARDRYRGEAGRAYHEEKRALPPAALPWVAHARAELFQAHVQPGHSVFEYGCGYGWNLMSLHCARRAGYDPAEAVQEALVRAGIESVPSTASISSGTFDVVISHHSLEHLPDPFAALVEMKRLLKPVGLLLLAVPYENERRYRTFDPAEPNHHLFSWNAQTLGNLVSITGLELRSVRLRKYGYDRLAARLAAKFGLGEAGFRAVRRVGWTLKPLREVVIEATSQPQPS